MKKGKKMQRRQFFKTAGGATLLAGTGLMNRTSTFPALLMDFYALGGKQTFQKLKLATIKSILTGK